MLHACTDASACLNRRPGSMPSKGETDPLFLDGSASGMIPGVSILTILFNGVALTASIIALVTSAVFALRQSRLMRHANQIPIMIDLFNQVRSPEFVRKERHLWAALSNESDPRLGFQGMSDDMHDSAYSVYAYYQMVAFLVAFGVLDKRLAILPLHYRVVKTWSTVKSYVYAERDLRGDKYSFLNFFEDFALTCERESSEEVYLYVRNQALERRHLFRRGSNSSIAAKVYQLAGDSENNESLDSTGDDKL